VTAPEGPRPEAEDLLRAGGERPRLLGDLWERHRLRLLKMVHLRMDPRVKARLGASDVLQEAFVEVSRRLDEYLERPDMPFFLWVRFLTAQTLVGLHRHHLGAQKRDPRRQAADAALPGATSVALADHLMAHGTTPTEGAVRADLRRRLEEALDRMEPKDRDVLVLRHFEELTNAEAAQELGIEPDAASKRYLRALRRLRAILGDDATDGGPSS
jgi:RNA polymerase sigma-70 factor (ECF subfamily)